MPHIHCLNVNLIIHVWTHGILPTCTGLNDSIMDLHINKIDIHKLPPEPLTRAIVKLFVLFMLWMRTHRSYETHFKYMYECLSSSNSYVSSENPSLLAIRKVFFKTSRKTVLQYYKQPSSLLLAGLTLISPWISNRMQSIMRDVIAYLFPNSNRCTVEVWWWIYIFIPHFFMYVITYSCWD